MTCLHTSSHWDTMYLGVHINSKLSWNYRYSANAVKATRVLKILRHNLYGCSISTKSRAFRVLVIPILEYSTQVWNHTKKNIDKLEAIQFHDLCWVYVAVDTIEQHSHGVNHLFNVGVNWTGHHIPLDVIISPSLLCMICYLTAPVFTFQCILLFLPHVLDLILFLYIVNSLTLTPIGIPFY